MSLPEVVLAIVKILFMVLFFLNCAGLATWAERRQSAMVQDRVGPNRAVINLPSNIVRLIVLLPPSVLGAFAWAPAIPFLGAYNNMRPIAGEVLTITAQLAVLVGWFSLLVLVAKVRSSGAINKLEQMFEGVDPRSVFYGGVAVHALAFAATSMVPPDAVITAARVTSGVLGTLFFLAGVYSASRVPDGTIPIRLAGTLHALADSVKMVWKEDFIPKHADRLLHGLAPVIALFAAVVTIAVLPFGASLCVGGNPAAPLAWSDLTQIAPVMGREMVCRGHVIKLQIVDLNVGILFMFAMGGTGVIGAAIAGWASDNKYALLGGLRAASQMVSYEVAMGLSLVGLFLIYGSVRLGNMVEWQGENAWGIFVQPVAFFLFLAAMAAETKRVPFDQPEGESEIVAGYFVEYSGFKWGMFMTGEYLELIISSALLVTLFFGGYALPFLHADGITVAFGEHTLFQYKMTHIAVVVISVLAFCGKVVLMSWLHIFIRWTVPRFRYDQVMSLGWTKLLPLSLANMMVTGIVVLALHFAGPGAASITRMIGDITQAIVAVGALAGFVALVVGLLEPAERNKFLQSSAARFAAAAGGTKAEPQQA
ncbi:MAG: NADH-quinone oxidoreductase subunit H [Minicystis sp.]